jgi:hypothetical protein
MDLPLQISCKLSQGGALLSLWLVDSTERLAPVEPQCSRYVHELNYVHAALTALDLRHKLLGPFQPLREHRLCQTLPFTVLSKEA